MASQPQAAATSGFALVRHGCGMPPQAGIPQPWRALAPPPSNPSLYSFSGNGEQAVACSPFPLAEGEGFEPPEAFTSTVFKFYFLFVVFRLLLLFSSPNCRKISVLTALLSDNSGFLLCFGIVSHSLALLIFSAFLTTFCRDFVDCFAWIKKFICCFILFLFPTNTRHGAKQIFAYQSNQESV